MDLTTLFGGDASLDTTTPTNPVFGITFANIAAAAGWDTAPTTGTGIGAKLLLALIRHVKSVVGAITDNTSTVTIGNPTVSVQTINNTLTTVYTYPVGFRVPFGGTATPDPDDI